jgi:hypothetical protein
MKVQDGLDILKFSTRKVQIIQAVDQEDFAKICHKIAGNVTIETANIIGIIPA